ncbi:MAG: cytochrome P450 [Pseudomonadota bacterium]
MTQTAPFTPVTVTPLPAEASTFAILRTAIRNPVELWPTDMYRERTFTSDLLGQRVHTTADPEMIKAVLQTHAAKFPKSDIEQVVLERATGQGLLTAAGAEWRKQRRMTAPIFRPKTVEGIAPVMIEAGREVATKLAAESGDVDVLPHMANATLKIIGSTLLSGDEDALDFDAISEMVDVLLDHLGKIDFLDFFDATRTLPRPWGRKGRRAVRWLQQAASDAANARRLSEREASDLLALLLSAVDPKTGAGLTEEEIRDNILTFIGAGHETTSLALSWTLYLLAHHPEWQERLWAERHAVCGDGPVRPDQIDALPLHAQVVQEAMRLYPPVPLLNRMASEDIELCGIDMKAGDVVAFAIYVLHRHEHLWDNPTAFDPTRFAPEREANRHRFQYIPFSAGPRICIGWKFAMTEAVAILSELMAAIRVAPIPGRDPYPRARITLRPVGGMPLHVTPRT